jgi:flagellar motor switch protein FliM
MDKLLTQAEIDALFRAAQGAGSATPQAAGEPIIEPWDLHQAGLLGEAELHSVTEVQENLARGLTNAVGYLLHDQFNVTLSAVEQLSYRDFLARFSEMSYCASFYLPASDAQGVLQLDVNLASAIVDLLLGGPGVPAATPREVTEIEENLLESIGRILCTELQSAWHELGLQFEFERRQPASQTPRILPMQEITLSSAFEITMSHCKGMLNLAFPPSVSGDLMRKLRTEGTHPTARGPSPHQEQISRHLLRSALELELASRQIPTKLSDLLVIQPGAVLKLRCGIEEPMLLRVGGRDLWSSRVVNSRDRRGAQLLEYLGHEEGRNADEPKGR